jgi:hypothetical protein
VVETSTSAALLCVAGLRSKVEGVRRVVDQAVRFCSSRIRLDEAPRLRVRLLGLRSALRGNHVHLVVGVVPLRVGVAKAVLTNRPARATANAPNDLAATLLSSRPRAPPYLGGLQFW